MAFKLDEIAAAVQFQVQAGLSNLDANESIFFARQLEYIRPQIFDVKRPRMSAFEVFPIDRSVPDWAETVTYTMYDATGIAKIIASYADDLPMVGVNGKQFSSKVQSLGDAYGWSTAEIRAASATNTPLKPMKARMAFRGHELAGNKIAWFGDSAANLPGFLSNTNIPLYVVPAVGTGSSKLWSTKTPDQILDDLNGVTTQVLTQSKGVHKATEVWMPISKLAYIKQKLRSSASDLTIYQAFIDANPGVTIRGILELEAVAAYSGLDVLVAAENTVDNFQFILPMMFREEPPQAQNLAWKVPCESRIGGVVIEYPFAFAIGSGI